MTATRILGALLVAVAPIAAAERSVEIAPTVGYRNGATLDASSAGTGGAEASASWSWGLSFGWWVRPDGWLEVIFDRQTLDFEPDAGSAARPFDIDVDYLQFGGGYEPPRAGLRPYVTAAFGLSRYGADPGSVSDATGLSASIGGGFKVPLSSKALLRLEARGFAVITSSSTEVVCGPGCSFSFSGSGFWQVGLRAAVAFRPGGAR